MDIFCELYIAKNVFVLISHTNKLYYIKSSQKNARVADTLCFF